MSRYFNETFEADGYDEVLGVGWEQGAGAGCSVDPNANTDDVSNPAGWLTRALKIDYAAAGYEAYARTITANKDISYSRIEFIITADGLVNNENLSIINCNDSSWGSCWAFHFGKHAEGDYYFAIYAFYDDAGHWITGFTIPALNTKYRLEIKWDITNHLWSWKVNGVVQPNNVDDTFPVESEGILSSTHAIDQAKIGCGSYNWDIEKAYTIYFDNVAFDDVDWIGAEIAENPYPIAWLSKNLISGYHVFLKQYLRSKVLGYDPLKLPDGTLF